jgi:hypothetical protein
VVCKDISFSTVAAAGALKAARNKQHIAKGQQQQQIFRKPVATWCVTALQVPTAAAGACEAVHTSTVQEGSGSSIVKEASA